MDALLHKLDEVEAQMKAIGYWSATEPPEQARQTFEYWLQYSFLPVARRRIQQHDLPHDSNVGVMALRQYDYHSHVPEAQPLLQLLTEFDVLVQRAAPTTP